MTGRGIKWILVVKCAWLAANLTVWLMGLGSCLTEPDCWLARYSLLPILFCLSFPGSILFMIVNEALIATGFVFDVTSALHYTFLSLGAIIVGYIQWFRVVPALFGRQQIIELSLNQSIGPGTGDEETPPERSRPAHVKAPQIQPFDNTGRSPLERAINRKQRRRLTNVS